MQAPSSSVGASVAVLQTLVEGLCVPSESDAPISVFCCTDSGEPSVQSLIATLGIDPDQELQTETIQTFFDPLVAQQPWFDEPEQKAADRFRDLLDYLQRNLSDLRVYRVGRATQTVLVVGRASSSAWIVLKTQVVET